MKIGFGSNSGIQELFRLPAAHAEVLAEPDSLNYLAPLAQIVVGAARPVHRF